MEQTGKKWWQSKTLWASVAAVVTAVGDMAASGHVDVTQLALAVFGVVGAFLRLKTGEPISGTAAAMKAATGGGMKATGGGMGPVAVLAFLAFAVSLAGCAATTASAIKLQDAATGDVCYVLALDERPTETWWCREGSPAAQTAKRPMTREEYTSWLYPSWLYPNYGCVGCAPPGDGPGAGAEGGPKAP